jgi:hypothetical protein
MAPKKQPPHRHRGNIEISFVFNYVPMWFKKAPLRSYIIHISPTLQEIYYGQKFQPGKTKEADFEQKTIND